ncbi:MAG TPA: rod-binding protein [Terriglobia bacterium]|nr:rod-binding protein [Terriglobia bacterium]
MNALTVLPVNIQKPFTAGNVTSGGGSNPVSPTTPQGRKLLKECQQFESILIASWWNEVEKGLKDISGPDSDPGSDTMQGMGIQSAAAAIAANGGLGIANMLYHELAPSLHQAAPAAQALKKS